MASSDNLFLKKLKKLNLSGLCSPFPALVSRMPSRTVETGESKD